ncbi:iripin-2-like [Dermacentor albipictus]|uniref:iripin-2-like n=1 Tax=Dermacentor albipictus TaxID=60249 RepID=UPI0038FC88B1
MLAKFVLLASVLAVVHCDTDDNTLLARAHNQFGVNLLKYLAAQEPSSNVFFSPTSIAAAFGMAYVGSRGNSEAELDSVFGHTALGLTGRDRVLAAYKNLLELSTSPNVTLAVANMVLAQVGFPISESYKQQLCEIFDADLRSADFHGDSRRVAAEVNARLRRKTRDKISGILLRGEAQLIVLFILNAVYFRGAWVTKFNARKTVDKPFLNLGTNEVSKPAMHLMARLPHTRVDAYHASAVEIPYQGDRFSMVVLLPDNPTGLAVVRNGMSLDMLEDMSSKLSFKDVILQLPKFEMSVDYVLVPAMEALGLNSVFEGPANFSGISESVRLVIANPVHQAAVEVYEGGTTVSAVTGFSFRRTAAHFDPLLPIEFIVNRPFLYYIRERSTNRILFIGEVHTL